LAPDVLRHRLVLTYDALGDGVRPDDVLDRILSAVGDVRRDDRGRATAQADATTEPHAAVNGYGEAAA
jgi:hypothetical protein